MTSNEQPTQQQQQKKKATTKLSLNDFITKYADSDNTSIHSTSGSGGAFQEKKTSWADDVSDLPDAPSGETRPSYYSGGSTLAGGTYGTSSGRYTGQYEDRPGRGPQSNTRGRPGRSGYQTASATGTFIDDTQPPAPIDYNTMPRDAPYVSFLGNLPHQITDPQELSTILFDLFKVKPSHVKIPQDRVTGETRGFAYAHFETLDELIIVLQGSSRTIIKGRKIRIDTAEPGQAAASLATGSQRAASPSTIGNWRTTSKPVTGGDTVQGSTGRFRDNSPVGRGFRNFSPSRQQQHGGGGGFRNQSPPSFREDNSGSIGGWRNTSRPVTEVDPNALSVAKQQEVHKQDRQQPSSTDNFTEKNRN